MLINARFLSLAVKGQPAEINRQALASIQDLNTKKPLPKSIANGLVTGEGRQKEKARAHVSLLPPAMQLCFEMALANYRAIRRTKNYNNQFPE